MMIEITHYLTPTGEDPFQSWLDELEDVKARGETRGRALGQAQSILTVLQARSLSVSEAVRARILAATDEPTLTRWLTRAATAKASAEVID